MAASRPLSDDAADGGAARLAGTARIAGAPISWGVCEVPGWGYQLPAVHVLGQMHGLGLTATEFGPDGYLPADPAERASLLASHRLTAAGGFVPVVLHEPGFDPVPSVAAALDGFGDSGAVLVLAAATGQDGYDERQELDRNAWSTLLANLDRIAARAAERGFATALHPHVGTLVQGRADVLRVLDGSDIPLCLDTGHLFVGGIDPAELAAAAAGRIGHVHLKDVDARLAMAAAAGQYADAVRRGLYRPLGAGDADISGVVSALRAGGYQGWYVLEQDTMLAGPPDGEGPLADVRQSLDYLRSLL